MRKAGWGVWLAYDLDGSYEEGPPTLIDSAKRDRRWCQGNLQHSWLLFAEGFHPVNRFHLFLGIMGYVASPLWMLFLLISSIHTFRDVLTGRGHFYHAELYTSVFGWVVEVPQALALFVFTLLLLFLPKVISVFLTLQQAGGRAYGGPWRLVTSVVLEIALSTLLAPINMIFHSKFVPLYFARAGRGLGNAEARRQRRYRLARGDHHPLRADGLWVGVGPFGIHSGARHFSGG